MTNNSPDELAQSFIEQLFEDIVQSGSQLTLLHPTQNSTLNLKSGDEKSGLHIPKEIYPQILKRLKFLARANPNVCNIPYYSQLRMTVRGLGCWFEINIEPTVPGMPEQVRIKKMK